MRVEDLPLPGYPVAGDNRVDRMVYNGNRIAINATQYFSDIKPEVWAYKVGGYQVLHKWLKDRVGRVLSFGELEPLHAHSCNLGGDNAH